MRLSVTTFRLDCAFLSTGLTKMMSPLWLGSTFQARLSPSARVSIFSSGCSSTMGEVP